MNKMIFKIIFTLLGIIILDYGIIISIDGIGRAAMIFSGSIFCLIGSFIMFPKNK